MIDKRGDVAAFSWLGRVREPLRRFSLSFLRRLLATDEGRRLIVETLPGERAHDAPRPAVSEWPPHRAYPELGRAAAVASTKPAPVFITARFRTGSTLLWNLFRHVDGCTSYYEPLNERRWFDPAARGDRMDRTHVGAEEYWREYEGLSHLSRYYDERWTGRDLFMDRESYAPALRDYVGALIEAAPGRAVLQFNRVDFRLTWLRQQFPDARIVHLYRHPRDQWCSSLVDLTRVPRQISVSGFAAVDEFYLLRWATDLSLVFPFLRPDRAEHPYDLFYMIWALSYACGREQADVSLGLEDLSSRPAAEIARLMRACGIARYDLDKLCALIVPQAVGKWRAWADHEWFREREARADEIMAAFFRETAVLSAHEPSLSSSPR